MCSDTLETPKLSDLVPLKSVVEQKVASLQKGSDTAS